MEVLGCSGSYVHVKDLETEDEGYIHSLLLNDKRLNITRKYADVYCGDSKKGLITVKYDKEESLEWSVSKKGIIEVTKHSNRSFSVKGLSPGVVTLTVKCGEDKDTCEISCIDKWEKPETAMAESTIEVWGTPEKTVSVGKIHAGEEIIGRGNIPDKSDYVYISSGNIWGFIKLSDFPGIDYVMRQYHYFDKGYSVRFDSAADKIKEYSAVLNNVMMANFKLKVFSYINSYTSVADECKIMSYGLVNGNNLSSVCSKSGSHDTSSCLTVDSLRMDLVRKYGDGDGNVSKVVWTGHMLDGNARSNATLTMGNVIITPYGTFSETAGYPSVSDAKIREDRIYTLVHETGHQFGLHDHYCAGDISPITNKCSNIFCSSCYIGTIPEGCIIESTLKMSK